MGKKEYHLNKKPYGNHKMYAIDGSFLAHVDTKRMNWYLDRDLAVMLNKKDFKLTFKSKGDRRNANTKYYTLQLENKCVICGDEYQLSKHHVVPTQYRKYLPLKYKSKSSFDVLCVCLECHHEYEMAADILKQELLVKYGLETHDKDIARVKSYHNALNKHSTHLPDDKRSEMVEFLEDYFGDPIEEILAVDDFEFESSTSLMMKQLDDYESFIIMWRKHFLEHAKPQHLPQEWVDEIEIVLRV
jgi:hypothetical protein